MSNSNIRWFINEDAYVYSYDKDMQPIDYPGDYPTPFDTEAEAVAYAEDIGPWHVSEDYDEGYYLSGSGELSNDDSYIDYLNGH